MPKSSRFVAAALGGAAFPGPGLLLLLAAIAGVGCGKGAGDAAASPLEGEAAKAGPPAAAPTPIKPPFAVQGEAEGLLLAWYDEKGLHTATKRSDIPEARRGTVRVDSLQVAPDQRLDPDHVYVADLRAPAADGQYPVQKASRDWFDAQVDQSKPVPPPMSADQVVIYKAAWCGVCRSAASFLKQRHVPFVEKDIEKDPAAAAELQRKASAKGVRPTGVPVIDFHGELMLGFDKQELGSWIDRLESGGKAI